MRAVKKSPTHKADKWTVADVLTNPVFLTLALLVVIKFALDILDK